MSLSMKKLTLIKNENIHTTRPYRETSSPVVMYNSAPFTYIPPHDLIKVISAFNKSLKTGVHVHDHISVKMAMLIFRDDEPFHNKLGTLWLGTPPQTERTYFSKIQNEGQFRSTMEYLMANSDEWVSPHEITPISLLLAKKADAMTPIVDLAHLLKSNNAGAFYLLR